YVFALVLGIIAYLLVLTKPLNVILCVGLFVVFITLKLSKPLASRHNFRRTLGLTIVFWAAPLIGMILLQYYYKLTIGDFFSSPYSFGDADFAALSLQHLKFAEVLFSSWHGLFFYHPLMAVVVFWLSRELVVGRLSYSEPAFWIILSAIGAFVFQTL